MPHWGSRVGAGEMVGEQCQGGWFAKAIRGEDDPRKYSHVARGRRAAERELRRSACPTA